MFLSLHLDIINSLNKGYSSLVKGTAHYSKTNDEHTNTRSNSQNKEKAKETEDELTICFSWLGESIVVEQVWSSKTNKENGSLPQANMQK